MEKLSVISKMIDHSLLHPTFTDEFLRNGCILAKDFDTASVCIKPYAVNLAKEILNGEQCKSLYRYWISPRQQQYRTKDYGSRISLRSRCR